MLYQDEIESLNKELQRLVSKYEKYTVKELLNMYQINVKAKNRLSILTTHLLENHCPPGIESIRGNEDFLFKTIKLDAAGHLKESISLPPFKYEDLYSENWETSTLRYYFYDKTFAFTVFRGDDDVSHLQKIVIWSMPEHVLEKGVREAWQQVHDCICQGKIVSHVDEKGHFCTLFPASSQNPYVHVRPHAKNRQDTYPLPVPDQVTGMVEYPKHSFWINRRYVLQIISDK